MQHDEMIWQVVNHQFCSYKTTIGKALSDRTHFCRNPWSVTGLCNRTSCPLANSKYATIREEKGRIHLFIKTVERAHSPKNLWEKILLSRNYAKALTQLDEHLAYFPKVLIHRNKQRLTKIHQYLIRMRKIELKRRAGTKASLVTVHRKIDQREDRRERKALIAAKLERNIEKELVERLAKGTYGDIYNFPEMPYQKALDTLDSTAEQEDDETEAEENDTAEIEYVEDLDEDELEDEEDDMEEMDYLGHGDWGDLDDDENDNDTADDENDDDDDDEDDTDAKRPARKKPPSQPDKSNPKRSKSSRIEIVYEEEREDVMEAASATETAW
jgi:protein MAK16